MGHTHYWYRPHNIDPAIYTAIKNDFLRLLPLLEKAGIKLAGPFGAGEPIIDDATIAFNGVRNCGHDPGHEFSIPWPPSKAGGALALDDPIVGRWRFGIVTMSRYCDGDCSCESFVFERLHAPEKDKEGPYFSFCKTALRPYDLPVTAFLIIAKHHMGHALEVSTDGDDTHWFDAKLLCQVELGYGLNYSIEDGQLVENKNSEEE
jgi:hypothetical protein